MSAGERRLIVGLDVPTVAEAERVVRALDGVVSFYKVGYQLAFAGGLIASMAFRPGDRLRRAWLLTAFSYFLLLERDIFLYRLVDKQVERQA